MQDLLINARYIGRQMTGVDRVAHELISALKAHPDFTLQFQLRNLAPKHPNRTPLSQLRTLWHEQITLARIAPRSLLLSPCNTGPALRRNHVVLIHDAQVYSQPESYRRMFRARYKLLMPLLGRRAKRIVVPSNFTKTELLRYGLTSEHKIYVVPNGADHILRVPPACDILHRHGLKARKFFLAMGSLAPHKNLGMLIRAAAQRADQSHPLVIAGSKNEQVFQHLNIGQTSSVKWIGRITDSELRALYENATALVFPSLTEGFGLPPAEAMACGCPVIATTGGAVPEVCAGAALLINPSDQRRWRIAMQMLSANAPLRHELITKGRRQVAKFTWHSAADQLADIITECPSDNRIKPDRRGVPVAARLPKQSHLG